nr:hypothetical protein [Pandoravirus belohorizontensis]
MAATIQSRVRLGAVAAAGAAMADMAHCRRRPQKEGKTKKRWSSGKKKRMADRSRCFPLFFRSALVLSAVQGCARVRVYRQDPRLGLFPHQGAGTSTCTVIHDPAALASSSPIHAHGFSFLFFFAKTKQKKECVIPSPRSVVSRGAVGLAVARGHYAAPQATAFFLGT